MPVISAVTPCLNDAHYLSEMIESFLAQDYPHKELVVQDGGSTDDTHEILRRYPIRWSVAPDSGPHDAINKAILASRGDLIVIMPANDLFAPGAFTRAVNALGTRPEAAMVYGDCRIIKEDGTVTRIDQPGPLDIDQLTWKHCLQLQSAYIRREAFGRVGFLMRPLRAPEIWNGLCAWWRVIRQNHSSMCRKCGVLFVWVTACSIVNPQNVSRQRPYCWLRMSNSSRRRKIAPVCATARLPPAQECIVSAVAGIQKQADAMTPGYTSRKRWATGRDDTDLSWAKLFCPNCAWQAFNPARHEVCI